LIAEAVADMLPYILFTPAECVRPPVNTKLSAAASPYCTYPVFWKFTLLVNVLLPKNARLEAVAAVTKVPTVTVPVNVPVEQLVTVNVPIVAATLPDTPNVPVVLIVTFAVPETLEKLVSERAPDEPAPSVRVLVSAIDVAPRVIAPEPPLSVQLSLTVVVVFRLIAELVAEIEPYILLVPTVWMTPFVNAKLSAAASPNATLPIFKKVVVTENVLAEPVNATL
jgi:hypothetical protein